MKSLVLTLYGIGLLFHQQSSIGNSNNNQGIDWGKNLADESFSVKKKLGTVWFYKICLMWKKGGKLILIKSTWLISFQSILVIGLNVTNALTNSLSVCSFKGALTSQGCVLELPPWQPTRPMAEMLKEWNHLRKATPKQPPAHPWWRIHTLPLQVQCLPQLRPSRDHNVLSPAPVAHNRE